MRTSKNYGMRNNFSRQTQLRKWSLGCLALLLFFIWKPDNAGYLTAQSPIPVSEDSVLFEKTSFLILFNTDWDYTRSFPEEETNRLLEILEDEPNLKVRLEARTDSVGDYTYNKDLATRRMEFAKRELQQRGVKGDRFIENVYGEDLPLAPNISREGRQTNRSVKVAAGYQTAFQEITGRMISKDAENGGIEGMMIIGSRYHRDTLFTDSTGKFTFIAPAGEIFSMEFYSGDHIMERTYHNLSREAPTLGEVEIERLEVGATFDFEDILFISNRAVLMPGFQDALPRLLRTVSFAANYRFEIQGHVNNPFSPPQPRGTFYYDLSERRARKVYNYLIENDIDSTRLEWKAYSNSKMIYPRARTENEMKYNRRVTVKVLGKLEDEMRN